MIADRIKAKFPASKNVADSTIELFEQEATRAAITDGARTTHPMFDDLVDAYICHLLVSQRLVDERVSSKSVGDVSTSFAKSGEKTESFFDTYKRLLIKVAGIRRF